ncbi:MAG: prolyl oligopeptidase family serine peptidase [Victivallales bacterium]|nr:prolyl oligopeptidase family serine peptidase [Victivallales bacterium]
MTSAFPGITDRYHDYTRHTFEFDGVRAMIVVPDQPRHGRLWLWRARLFDTFPYVDLAMLQEGFYLVHIDIADLYGGPAALARWDRFYEFLVREYSFARRPILEGFSRGALTVYNWAARNPEQVAAIYADNPVCDLRSWPLGLMSGPGSEVDAEKCLQAYGITAVQAENFSGSPVDHLEPLVEAGIPIIHVCGDADEIVPYPENTGLLLERLRKLGGDMKLILKPGQKHHPHSLEDPTPIVEFLIRNMRR